MTAYPSLRQEIGDCPAEFHCKVHSLQIIYIQISNAAKSAGNSKGDAKNGFKQLKKTILTKHKTVLTCDVYDSADLLIYTR